MYGRLARAVVGAVVGALLVLLWASSAQAATLPAGFAEETVVSGLTQPTAVRFSSDGRVFVAEKSGLIKEFDSLSDTTPRVYADLRQRVHDFWDRGLLSIALDPSFPTRSVIYALYTYDAPIGGTAPVYNDACADPTGAGCKVSGRLSRILPDGSEQVMIEDWCQQYPSHSIGSLAFGPDGQLYASGGDGASFNWVDYGQGGGILNRCADPPNEGGALRSQDMRTTSDLTADPVTLDGTVIRIDPNTGEGSAGNPFASSSDANARRIVAYGLRNPFRINFRPGTRELWAGDVGWNEWEEINTLTDASDAAAENFGWPCYEGTLRQPGYDNQNLPICETLYGQSNAVTAPFYRYRHSDQVIPGESCPIGGSAIAGLSFAFYGGGPYPAEYDGALFFADYTRRCIWAMERGGTTRPSPSNIKGFVGGAASPVELQIGPDGNLYYVDIGGGTIRRITYTAGANQPPVAVAKANPASGDIGMTVNFDGSGSSDPNGDPLSYEWDLDGDGAFDDSSAVRPSWTYNTAGNYRVSLRVSDGRGGTATDAITIGVGRPNVTISTPTMALRWKVGDTVSFSGSATDNQGAAIPASSLTWSLVLKHGACPDCHDHPLQNLPGVASGSFQAPDHAYPSHLELSLTATDSNGLAGTASVQLHPLTTTLRFATNPTGLTLTFNGANATAPFDRTVIVNSTNSVSAPSPQNLRGTGKQVFKSWSDGVTTPTRTIVAPPSGGAYTANFAKR
jgi:glucose/arabinose dehydrogenase/PKD repeat protein